MFLLVFHIKRADRRHVKPDEVRRFRPAVSGAVPIIGPEMATVYHALGAAVTVVALMDQIIPGAGRDIVTPPMPRISA